MAWSKVEKPFRKPLGWWYHKFMCEIGHFIEQKFNSLQGMAMYYNHLSVMCDKYGYNLYGQKL